METADAHRQPDCAKRPGEIESARKLVRLDAYEPDQRSPAGFAKSADDPLGSDALVGFIKGVEADLDFRAEYLAGPCIFGERIQGGECV